MSYELASCANRCVAIALGFVAISPPSLSLEEERDINNLLGFNFFLPGSVCDILMRVGVDCMTKIILHVHMSWYKDSNHLPKIPKRRPRFQNAQLGKSTR